MRASSPAVEKRLGPDHLRIAKRVLVNGGDAKDAPTASNITDAVGLLRQARETDTVVLFIAAHGINKGPTDAARMDGAMRGSTVVPIACRRRWRQPRDANAYQCALSTRCTARGCTANIFPFPVVDPMHGLHGRR
jgi:hypothetical protein